MDVERIFRPAECSNWASGRYVKPWKWISHCRTRHRYLGKDYRRQAMEGVTDAGIMVQGRVRSAPTKAMPKRSIHPSCRKRLHHCKGTDKAFAELTPVDGLRLSTKRA